MIIVNKAAVPFARYFPLENPQTYHAKPPLKFILKDSE